MSKSTTGSAEDELVRVMLSFRYSQWAEDDLVKFVELESKHDSSSKQVCISSGLDTFLEYTHSVYKYSEGHTLGFNQAAPAVDIKCDISS